jgi:hypothetical protein
MSEISSSNDPAAGLNFILDVQGMRAGFAEVDGLASDTDIIEYRDGNEDITIGRLPRIQKHVNIVL